MILTNIEDVLNNMPDDLPYKSSVRRVLIQAPKVEVHGEETAVWQKRDNTDKGFAFICSACGETAYARPNARGTKARVECTYRFCPNCGARMDGGTE